MAPLMFDDGTWYPPPFGSVVNTVGPLYVGSVLFTPVLLGSGCVMVLVGHCTRNDCAWAPTARQSKKMGNQTWRDFLMTVRPPSGTCVRQRRQVSMCESAEKNGVGVAHEGFVCAFAFLGIRCKSPIVRMQ